MLKLSPRLRVLHLITARPIMIPVIGQLTHLFTSCHQMSARCTRTIGRLSALQILILRVKEHQGDDAGPDMRQCRELRALILQLAMPKALQCPGGC
jgi:hypothetical protein